MGGGGDAGLVGRVRRIVQRPAPGVGGGVDGFDERVGTLGGGVDRKPGRKIELPPLFDDRDIPAESPAELGDGGCGFDLCLESKDVAGDGKLGEVDGTLAGFVDDGAGGAVFDVEPVGAAFFLHGRAVADEPGLVGLDAVGLSVVVDRSLGEFAAVVGAQAHRDAAVLDGVAALIDAHRGLVEEDPGGGRARLFRRRFFGECLEPVGSGSPRERRA